MRAAVAVEHSIIRTSDVTDHWFCAELLRNNGNLKTLLRCTLDHLEAAQAARATQTQLEQAAAALMLVWLLLRHTHGRDARGGGAAAAHEAASGGGGGRV